MAKKDTEKRIRITNRKARRDYHILDTLEAGIQLCGTEVKSLRESRGNLNDSYATVENGEVWVHQFNITPYSHGNRFNHDPDRPRKLLLHKEEIVKLANQVNQKGFTIVPLQLYFNKRNIAKMEIAVARGKFLYDKREDIKKRTQERELQRDFRHKGLQRFL